MIATFFAQVWNRPVTLLFRRMCALGFQLGGGWQIAAGPTISYDHTRDSSNRWTVPLGIGLSRTQVLGGRPWKFQLQYWNYVEKPDAFGPEHQLRLSINPVVTAPWNEGK